MTTQEVKDALTKLWSLRWVVITLMVFTSILDLIGLVGDNVNFIGSAYGFIFAILLAVLFAILEMIPKKKKDGRT